MSAQSVRLDHVEVRSSNETSLRFRWRGKEYEVGWRQLVPYPGHRLLLLGGGETLELRLEAARELGIVP